VVLRDTSASGGFTKTRRRFTLSWLLVLLLILVGAPLAGARPGYAAALAGGDAGSAGSARNVTARLGISAGAAIEDAPLGLPERGLRERTPILFDTARRLDVRIETASVGQGFFSDGGVLLSEKDLDLVVTGRRDRITVMAATLGKAFDQSVVFVWFFGREHDGDQATATIPLPGGAEALTTPIYQQLVTELADGGHVRYAGRDSLLFVANTGDEPDEAFFDRMDRVRALLARSGIPTRPARCDQAEFVALDRDSYDEVIAGQTPKTVTTAAAGGSKRPLRPDRRCAA
jgi:hypothetical protein